MNQGNRGQRGGVSMVALLGLIAAILAVMLIDPFKNAVAGRFEARVRSTGQSEEFTKHILKYAERPWLIEKVLGKRVDLNARFAVSALREHDVEAETRDFPFIQLRTKHCPNSRNRSTYITYFIEGADSGAFGWADPGESVSLDGVFSLSSVRTGKNSSGQRHCWVDLTFKESD
jgi:hypothetical protein